MNGIAVKRDIDTVTNEIINLRQQATQTAIMYMVEIGRRLTEAKGLVPHGEWGTYLKDKVEFSQKTANNFMRIYEEYGTGQLNMFNGNSQALANLDYTKIVALLALPGEERESFAEENDVENKSTREVEKLVRERNEALKKAESMDRLQDQLESVRAKAELNEKTTVKLTERINELNKSLADARQSEQELKDKVKKLKNNPTIPESLMSEIKEKAEQEASAELEKRIEANKKELAEAQKAQEAAQADTEKAKERIAELEKQIRMQNPAVTEFKRLFEQAQVNMLELNKAVENLKDSDAELAGKLERAVQAFLRQYVSKEF